MALEERFLPFYLDGRDAKLARISKLCPDAAEIAKEILQGKSLRTVIGDHAAQAGDTLARNLPFKRKWLHDNDEALEDLVSEHPANKDGAFAAFIAGMADELAYVLEDEVVGELNAIGGDDDEGEGEEEDEEDEETEGEKDKDASGKDD